METEVELQRQYYAKTATQYNDAHVCEGDEHYMGLSFLVGMLDFLNVESVLDVGSGTGRAIVYLAQKRPDIKIVGIEPVEELRNIGYEQGMSREMLVGGDALKLPFEAGSFDVVCAFGVLHHIRTPDKAIAEMLRVAKKGIFISDANNFGRGSKVSRLVKQTLRAFGLWKVATFITSKGKGYYESDGDGIAYSYSLFDSYDQIKASCKSVHLLNTVPSDKNLYRSASHIGLLGIK